MSDKEFVLVSQGIEIMRTKSQEKAINYVKKENDDWFDYKQRCIDNYEDYADNYIDLEIEYPSNNILTELEEWLKERIEWNKSILEEDKGKSDLLGFNFHREAYIKIWEDTLDKIQELKEKYK